MRSGVIATLSAPVILTGACAAPSGDDLSSRGMPVGESSSVTILYPSDDLGPSGSAPTQYLVFLTLVRRTPSGELEGRLARSWERSPDGRGWTVQVRTDLRWHDGTPVTAKDVEFTLDLYGHPDVLWTTPGAIDVHVLNDSTYSVQYAETIDAGIPIGSPLDWYYPIYPEHLLRDEAPARFHEWEFWQHPIGNGPYRVVRRVPLTGLVLESNPDFPLPAPAIDQVIIQSGGPSLVELQAGNVNAIASVPGADVPKLRADERFDLYYAYNLASLSAVLWNHDRAPFDDPRVRRALTFAIDRGSILEFLSAPDELVPIDVLFTEDQFREGQVPPGLGYDPDSARVLLDAAGWADSDGDGIRDRNGEQLRFSLLVSTGGGPWFPDHQSEAVIVQANLRSVGVDAEILSVDAAVGSERTREGEFDAAIFDIKEGNRLLLFGPGSMIGYRSSRAAGLIEAATREIDRNARSRLFEQLGQVLRQDLPFTLLQPMVTWTAADPRLRGLSSPWRSDPIWYMDSLWWGITESTADPPT